MPVEDIFADADEVIETKYYEFNGKAFKINREGPYSHWVVRHATGQIVKIIEGSFTNYDAAIRAIHQLPDEYFEKVPKKMVLTPKNKEEVKSGETGRTSS